MTSEVSRLGRRNTTFQHYEEEGQGEKTRRRRRRGGTVKEEFIVLAVLFINHINPSPITSHDNYFILLLFYIIVLDFDL